MYIYIHTHMYPYLYVYVCIYVCIYICTFSENSCFRQHNEAMSNALFSEASWVRGCCKDAPYVNNVLSRLDWGRGWIFFFWWFFLMIWQHRKWSCQELRPSTPNHLNFAGARDLCLSPTVSMVVSTLLMWMLIKSFPWDEKLQFQPRGAWLFCF